MEMMKTRLTDREGEMRNANRSLLGFSVGDNNEKGERKYSKM